MTDYEKILSVFYSIIRNKYELPEGLINQWFFMACADYELDIMPICYDEETQMFYKITNSAINTIGLIMAKFYCQREQSRINKLNNIIGKNLQLNATGEAKRAVQAELENILYEIEQRLYK